MFDQRGAIPLYCQLQEILRSRIENGELNPGDQLPPLPELCAEFGLSQGTVRQALADLEQEGLIVRRQGKGNFVARRSIPQDLSVASSFSTYYKTLPGGDLGRQLISVDVVHANRSVANKLEVPEQTEVVAIRKLMIDQDEPFFVVTSYAVRSMFSGIEFEDHTSGSLIALLHEKYGLHITRVQGWLEATLTNDYESSLLKVRRRSPVMLYDRLRYAGSQPVVLSRHVIRGDKCRLTFQLEGDN